MPNSKNNPLSKSKKVKLLPYGFGVKAERISDEFRGYLQLKPHDPCPSDLLTNHLNIYVRDLNLVEGISTEILNGLLDEFGSAFSAVTLHCKANNRFMVVNNHTHSSARRESNLMHECAHLILKHEMEEFDSTNGFELRKYNDVQEEEAKYLGHCLQLPKAALTKYYVYENKTKEDIATKFNASIQVVNYRIKICGIENFKKNVTNKLKH